MTYALQIQYVQFCQNIFIHVLGTETRSYRLLDSYENIHKTSFLRCVTLLHTNSYVCYEFQEKEKKVNQSKEGHFFPE